MDDLTFTLMQLCKRNRDGSHATQADRSQCLKQMAAQLKEAGFRQLKAKSLSGKHVEALLSRWRNDQLSAGTTKNRLAHLRWWAEKIGKGGLLPSSNSKLDIPQRQYVTNEDKSRQLGTDALSKVTDAHAAASLRLEQAFGLRREEAIKFQPSYADRGDHIALKGSWTKGGRERSIPITTAEQRAALAFAHKIAGSGSLIPSDKKYIQQRNVYDAQVRTAGLSKMHGLRHAYAQSRYETLTGWRSPAVGGPPQKSLDHACRQIDAQARQIISRELGHERPEISKVYLGR